jgi:hypothetical protein
MNPLQVIYVLASITAFYVLFARMKVAEARLIRLENQKPVRPEPKAAPAQAKQVWDKKIEGFNPPDLKIVLPRSEEERKARVYTNWEIDSDYKIVG